MAYSVKEIQELQAAAQRLGLLENPRNSKIKRMTDRRTLAAQTAKKPVKQPRFETEEDRRVRVMRHYNLKPLEEISEVEPYDVTNSTRYAQVEDWTGGEERLQHILRQYGPAMPERGISPEAMKRWREQFMLMTPEQLGTLLRVSGRTVRNWEAGKSSIPFSMWWMMHCTLQDPQYFLSRPGFHDFYIKYENGTPLLCSAKWPDIRQSPSDLWINRAAINEMTRMRNDLVKKDEEIAELTLENTRIRKLLKVNKVTAELQAMQDKLTDLLKRVHTADVVEFPYQEPAHQAAA